MSFKETNCLITGGAGFIGSHLTRRLVNDGNMVTAADNLLSGNMTNLKDMMTKADFEFKRVDLRDLRNFRLAARFKDAVFHLAANMGGIGYISSIGADIMRDNLLMNVNFLEACRLEDIENALYSSSACAYPAHKQATPDVVPLKESDAIPAEPDQFYGWEKLVSERLCEAYNRDYGLKIRVLRYHNIYGPASAWEGGKEKAPAALCRKVAQASSPGTITVWGDGRQTRSFCYIDDAVEGTLLRMQSDYLEPLNIGSDRLVTIDELAELIIKISGKKLLIEHDLNQPQGVRGRNADLTLVKRILGWEPKTSLEDGITKTYEWVTQQ